MCFSKTKLLTVWLHPITEGFMGKCEYNGILRWTVTCCCCCLCWMRCQSVFLLAFGTDQWFSCQKTLRGFFARRDFILTNIRQMTDLRQQKHRHADTNDSTHAIATHTVRNGELFLKGQLSLKKENCHHLLTVMWFQTNKTLANLRRYF